MIYACGSGINVERALTAVLAIGFEPNHKERFHLIMRYQLFETGVFVDPMTAPAELQGLIDMIRPVKIDKPLIRLGGNSDGGYLIPDDLNGIESCFSPGVDVVAQFEADLLDRGIMSHLADYSVESVPGNIKVASFAKKYLGAINDEIYMTLEKWMHSTDSYYTYDDLILQMDIEGSEYEVLLSTPDELLHRFRIMVIEFHHIESWGQKQYFDIVKAVFKKLLKHFHIVHNHPNNVMGVVSLNGVLAPRVFELTFLRKDRADADGYVVNFPHPLDRPNVKHMPDLVMPDNWRPLLV